MRDLADIFLRHTGNPNYWGELPYAAESRFIKFAVLALEPAAMYFEVGASALSGRWERLVVEDRKLWAASQQPEGALSPIYGLVTGAAESARWHAREGRSW